ncbi:DnaJ C-terminal domain-containing protein [Mycoplasmopsis columbina]|uniref:Chaperone protein DnaJ n=1 Tax=Mycoplasmopsis columbina SF7 TaxID=1037410 RepID=F9UJP8_9BACT|nr:DnaJ C-terminal domain-containing protein [Mycoplasmopsis columbina]EGV00429.1 chaperone protein [Mycoplasmopsis columbina SF7]VEU76706.1 chaperone protein [Mycoplasmopsis columbina]
MAKKDFYEVLGVSKNATEQEIKQAYRKLAMQYHPDKLKDGTSDQKMQELNEAYEVLSDREKRANYDQFGTADGSPNFGAEGFNMGGFGSFSDIFGDLGSFFNFGSSRKNRTYQKIKGEDIEATINISLIDAINGKEIKQKLRKYELCEHCNGSGAKDSSKIQTCDQCKGHGQVNKQVRTPFGVMQSTTECNKCNGSGKVIVEKCEFCKGAVYVKKEKVVTFSIPKGTMKGKIIKLPGYGERGYNGAPSGDLNIHINIEEHKYFKYNGKNLYLTIPVTFLDIINEKTIEIPTPYGKEFIKLKSSYNNGDQIVIKTANSVELGSYGALIGIINVVMPKLNSKKIKELSAFLKDYDDDTNADFNKEVKKSN